MCVWSCMQCACNIQHTTYHQCAGMRGLVRSPLSNRRCRALSRSICTLPTLSNHSYGRCESDPPLRTHFAQHLRRRLYPVSLCPQNTAKGCVAPKPKTVTSSTALISRQHRMQSPAHGKRGSGVQKTLQERDYFTSTPKTARARALAGGWWGSTAISVGAHFQCRCI